jgi:arginine/lysine/ornithine decarboxylase
MSRQSRAPLCDAIAEFHERGMLQFTVPGHKCGKGIDAYTREKLGLDPFRSDVPELGGLDDRTESRQLRRTAEKLTAEVYGATECYFSVNGTSLSAHVAMAAVAEPGVAVALARNAHKSLIDASIFAGTRPVFLDSEVDEEHNIEHGVSPQAVEDLLRRRPDVRAVFVVSPTYYGVTSDLKELARVCHARNAALIVDEAWGAHFPFHKDFPPTGIDAGADLCICSVHKTMGGLQQASILLMQGDRIDPKRLQRTVHMFESTSPSSLILASIDGARRAMVLHGQEMWSRALALSALVRRQLARLPGIQVLGRELIGRPGCAGLDETKLVFDISGLELTGFRAADWLYAERRVALELADERRLLAVISPADEEQSIARLIAAIADLLEAAPRLRTGRLDLPSLRSLGGEWILSPSKAFFGPTQTVPIQDAAGRIGAELVTPYPPGVPRIRPGELITEAVIEYLQKGHAAGMFIQDAGDPSVKHLTVVDTEQR